MLDPYLGIINIHWELATRDVEGRRIVEKLAELFGIEGGGGDEELEVGTEASNVLDETKEDVGVEGAFMGFVNDHAGIRGEVGFVEEFAEEHAVGHVLDDSLV